MNLFYSARMTNIEKLKSIVLVFFFNIFLPTLDVGTDLRLIIKFWNMKIKYKEDEWSGFSISISLGVTSKKKIAYLKTLSKLRVTTHPPTLFLTNYFLTSFNKVEHPPYLLHY